ncbi:MAG: ABC transporter ATP-binding protein [Alphaproteobacteria bacterium]
MLFRSIARAISFIPDTTRGQWLGLVVANLFLSVLEAVAAVAVFALAEVMTNGGRMGGGLQGERLLEAARYLGVVDPVILLALLVAVFYVLKNLLSARVLYYQARVPLMSGARFARELFTLYLEAPYVHHLRRNSAEMLRNLESAGSVAFTSVLSSLVSILAELFVLTALMMVLFLKAPLTTLVAVVALGSVTYVLYAMTRRGLHAWGQTTSVLMAAMVQAIHQGLGAFKDLKVMGRESHFVAAYARGRFAASRFQALTTTVESLPRLVLETLLIAVMVVVVVVGKGSQEAEAGLVPLVGLYAYTGYRVMPSLNRILVGLQHIRFGAPSVDLIYDDLKLLSSMGPPRTRTEPPAPLPAWNTFTLSDLTYTYPETARPALEGITLHLKRGETVGVVGRSGAGKTTLIDVVLGLLTPERGDILLDGVSLREDMRGWQGTVGYVPQTVFLLDDTLRRNIAFGIVDDAIDERRIAEVVRIAQLEAFIESLPEGLGTMVGERGVRLSGGQRQRVAIARALYRDPEVLVLDEATSALDNRTERLFSEAIERLAGQKTLLVVAHRLGTVRRCDRILVMKSGRIVDAGSYDALLAGSEAFREIALHEDEGRTG